MANNIFSKFYKYKDTQEYLLSDSEFLTIANGTVIQKVTGEEYVKSSVNAFDKVQKQSPSLDEMIKMFARLNFDNTFTANNYFEGNIDCSQTASFNNVTATGTTSLAQTSITDCTITNASVTNKATIATAEITTLNGVTIRPKNANTGNIGLSNAYWENAYITNVYGTAQHSKYSDLAEKYTTVEQYPEGTVLEVYDKQGNQLSKYQGGTLAGVISTQPGVRINADLVNGQYVCLKGMVPVLCLGLVKKGQYCIAIPGGKVKGVDKSKMTFENLLNLVGVALEDSDNGKVLVKM